MTVRLEARVGEWHPDKDSDPGITVKAFAVEGGPLQIPGRSFAYPRGPRFAPSCATVSAGDPLSMHGLYTRSRQRLGPAAADRRFPPGETREFAFSAGTPGTYYYWGATAADTLPSAIERPGSDSQLSGAFIVDPRGASEHRPTASC